MLATPAEFTTQLGLPDLVSPLRLRGMAAMLARIKRQIQEQQAAQASCPRAGRRPYFCSDVATTGCSHHRPAATCSLLLQVNCSKT